MKSVTLIQLGDVHLPKHRETVAADVKDRSIPEQLRNILAPKKLLVVIRSILEVCQEREVAGVLICGDLTCCGCLPAYSECVTYLTDALRLADATRWTPEALHAVPGNHDIDRDKCDPQGADLLMKFEPLKELWAGKGLPIPAIPGQHENPVFSAVKPR